MLIIPSAVSPGDGASGRKPDGPLTVTVPVPGREERPERLFGRMVTSARQPEGPTVRSDQDGVANFVFPPFEEGESTVGPVATGVDTKRTTTQFAIGREAAAGSAASLPIAGRGESEPVVKAARDGARATSATGLPTLQEIQTPDRIDLGQRRRTGEAVDASPLRAGAPDTGPLGAYSSAVRPEAGRFTPNSSAFGASHVRSGDAGRRAGETAPGSIATAMESGAGLSVKTGGAVAERIPASEPKNGAPPASRTTTPPRVFPVTARPPGETPVVLPDPPGAEHQGVATSPAPGRSGIGRLPGDPGATVSPGRIQRHGQFVESRSGGGAPAASSEKSIPDAVAESRPASPAGGVGHVEARSHSRRPGTEPAPPPAPNPAQTPATGQAANESAAPVGPAQSGTLAMRERLSGMTASANSAEGRDLAETARDLPRPRLASGGAPPAAGGITAPGSVSATEQIKPEPRAPSASASDPAHSSLRSGTRETGQRQPAGSPEFQSILPSPHRTPGLNAIAGKPQVVVQGGEAGVTEARSAGGEGEPLPLSGEPPARSAAPAHGPAVVGPEQARAVAVSRQIAEAAGVGPNGQLEVSLSPEELGRVKLTITPQDAGLAIAIQAERPETLELMRRHIDVLVRELADEGFASLSFDFGQGDREAGRGFDGGEGPGDLPVVGDARGEAVAAEENSAPSRGGLDLRL